MLISQIIGPGPDITRGDEIEQHPIMPPSIRILDRFELMKLASQNVRWFVNKDTTHRMSGEVRTYEAGQPWINN
jgi:hypothetical protein